MSALTLKGSGEAADGFLDFNTMSVQAGGTWTIGHTSTVGKSTLASGALAIDGELTTKVTERKGATVTFATGGKLTLKGSSTFYGSVAGPGSIDLTAGASATLYGKVDATDTFTYADANTKLALNDLVVGGAHLFHGKIAGFGPGDKLDAGAPFGKGTKLDFRENAGGASGILTLTLGMTEASLTLLGSYATKDFHLSGDGHGGSLITYL